ncbi:MAG TPA: hypothetical protein VGW78_00535 [Candidatus Babeliales bacterium]|jgi:hypothetical protein|nr:hypothetical protein [Candidatus Babeliales bacterium]
MKNILAISLIGMYVSISYSGDMHRLNTIIDQKVLDKLSQDPEVYTKEYSHINKVIYNKSGTQAVFKGCVNLYKGKIALKSCSHYIVLNGYKYKYDGISLMEIYGKKLLHKGIEQKPIALCNPIKYAKQLGHLLLSKD